MKIEELFNRYNKLDAAQKAEAGKKLYAHFSKKMKENGYTERDALSFATMLIRLASGADNYGSEEELKLFEESTGVDTDVYEFFAMTKNADDESFVAAVDEIVDSFDKETKQFALCYAALFFSIDVNLSEKEKELYKLLKD